ncbi:MAG: hypothetical protein ACI9F9_002282, partial [Candidatus Paceibacteria bacterium]
PMDASFALRDITTWSSRDQMVEFHSAIRRRLVSCFRSARLN